jgi:adapter protein MecA 1/2
MRGEMTMEIKRIDDTTIKFTLSEDELLERGIEQDEIWNNRDKGETLFIDMMEAAYEKEQFEIDGPLWVEAHLFDDGVEITVTKGKKDTSLQVNQAGDKMDPALKSNNKGGNQMNHDMFYSQLQKSSLVTDKQSSAQKTVYYSSVYKFKDIENIIQLTHRLPLPFFDSKLIYFNNYYYLVVQYPEARWMRGKDWVESLILEYGDRGHTSIHRLEEYGNTIITDNAITTIKSYFRELN